MCGIYLSNIILAFAKNDARLELLHSFTSYSPLLGCAGDRVEMVLKVHCGTVLGDKFAAMLKIVESDRAHFELLSHETFAKLNVGAIAFESISLLLPNLCLLLVIVL